MASLPVPLNPKDPKNPTPSLYLYQRTPGGLTAEESRKVSAENAKKVPACTLKS